MSEVNKNKPAFPNHVTTDDYHARHLTQHVGISKREYFVAKAMQGWLASYGGLQTVPDTKAIAAKAVEIADALLAELEK